MFWFSKKYKLKNLQGRLMEVRKNAAHFYSMKESAEESAFYQLAELAREEGTSAIKAAKTKKGQIILAEVVLNRQWAFYLNESALQLQAEISRLSNPAHSGFAFDKELWFDNIITPAGLDIVMDQIEPICGKLIAEVDDYIK